MKILALCLLCATAQAQVTLDYSGDALGSVTLSAPLLANGTQTLTPLSFTFAPDVFNMLNSDFAAAVIANHGVMGSLQNASFSFTTVNGAITGWDIELFANVGVYANADDRQTASLTTTGDHLIETVCGDTCATVSRVGQGSWSTASKVASAPEIGSEGALSGLTLLLGCLAVMRGRRCIDGN